VRKAYLDDFPFPSYLVVRDTAHLPDAIADVTRQFLEMVVDRG
jgi:midasin (ATPase involved in ribosome maturation)